MTGRTSGSYLSSPPTGSPYGKLRKRFLAIAIAGEGNGDMAYLGNADVGSVEADIDSYGVDHTHVRR
jgi:hypothetical protein